MPTTKLPPTAYEQPPESPKADETPTERGEELVGIDEVDIEMLDALAQAPPSPGDEGPQRSPQRGMAAAPPFTIAPLQAKAPPPAPPQAPPLAPPQPSADAAPPSQATLFSVLSSTTGDATAAAREKMRAAQEQEARAPPPPGPAPTQAKAPPPPSGLSTLQAKSIPAAPPVVIAPLQAKAPPPAATAMAPSNGSCCVGGLPVAQHCPPLNQGAQWAGAMQQGSPLACGQQPGSWQQGVAAAVAGGGLPHNFAAMAAAQFAQMMQQAPQQVPFAAPHMQHVAPCWAAQGAQAAAMGAQVPGMAPTGMFAMAPQRGSQWPY